MGLRGTKPKGEISTKWSHDLAYAIGLIATDGNLSSNGRVVTFVSKDIQLINTLQDSLGISKTIHYKSGRFTTDKKYAFINICDILFYQFLLSIGLSPAKSKTMGALEIPDTYFIDFLRGSFDGDGSFYSYWDKRWASSFMFYLIFNSASIDHTNWLRKKIQNLIGPKGHAGKVAYSKAYQLKYAKQEARIIFERIYYSPKLPKLERKYKKVYSALAIDAKHTRNSNRLIK